MKLNNKGFAVTTILYTLLIAFLMFLGAALAMFSTSSSLISNANEDLINGTKLTAQQVKTDCNGGGIDVSDGNCWNASSTIVKINSRYGTMYWPRDFCEIDDGNNGTTKGFLHDCNNTSSDSNTSSVNSNVTAQCLLSVNSDGTGNYGSCDNKKIGNDKNEGIQVVSYKQSSNKVQRLSYVNEKATIVPLALDSNIQLELEDAADHYLDNGGLRTGDIRDFIGNALSNAVDNQDAEALQQTFTEKYSNNIEVEVKWASNISDYYTNDTSPIIDDISRIKNLNIGSFIISLKYTSGGKEVTYNIIDFYYLMDDVLSHSENSNNSGEYINADDARNYFRITDPNLNDASAAITAIVIAADIAQIENTYGNFTRLMATYEYNGNLYSDPSDITMSSSGGSTGGGGGGTTTPSEPASGPKFLKITDSITNESVDLNLYNLYN